MNKFIALLLASFVLCALAARPTSAPKGNKFMSHVNDPKQYSTLPSEGSSYSSQIIGSRSVEEEQQLEARSNDGFQNAYCQYDPTKQACPFVELKPIPIPSGVALPGDITNSFRQIKNMFDRYNTDDGYQSGAAASITYNGASIWNYTYGTVSWDSTAKPNGDTIFRIASVTKVFTALAVMRLLQDGLITSLDDPIKKYYPSFSIKSFYNDTRGPTIRQLLGHTAGTPREVPCSFYDGSCYDSTATILGRVASQYTYFPAGRQLSYSNLGFSLLGRLLESKMGTTWENYVQTKILNPLGMTSTYLEFGEGSFYPRMAAGYGFNYGYTEVWYVDIGFVAPSGNMFSTVNDLNKLLAELNKAWASIYPTKTVNTDLIKQLMQPAYVPGDLQNMFGLPFEIYPHSGFLVRTKSGNIDGFASMIATVPELQLTFSMLWNSDYPDVTKYLLDAMDIFLPAVIRNLDNAVPVPQIASSVASKLVGRYNTSIEGNYATFTATSNGGIKVMFTYNGPLYYWLTPTIDKTVYTMTPLYNEFKCGFYQYSGNPYIAAYFKFNAQGKAIGFDMPAAYYGYPFSR